MSRLNRKKRSMRLRIRHKKREKMRRLRTAYTEAKNETERRGILEKVQRIDPGYPEEVITSK